MNRKTPKTITTTPRKIYDSEHTEVWCYDEPGAGGACHRYLAETKTGGAATCEVKFQEGAIQEHGVNGITNEDLLAILKHRMEGFVNGPFPCVENDIALKGIDGTQLPYIATQTAGRGRHRHTMKDTKILEVNESQHVVLSDGSYHIVRVGEGKTHGISHNNAILYESISEDLCQQFLTSLSLWLLKDGNAKISVHELMS